MPNNLKIIRKHRGLTQYELGIKAGHAPGSAKANVSRDEKKDTFQSHLAKKYAVALSCSADDLFDDNLSINDFGNSLAEKGAGGFQPSNIRKVTKKLIDPAKLLEDSEALSGLMQLYNIEAPHQEFVRLLVKAHHMDEKNFTEKMIKLLMAEKNY